jgi:hypothetical protein
LSPKAEPYDLNFLQDGIIVRDPVSAQKGIQSCIEGLKFYKFIDSEQPIVTVPKKTALNHALTGFLSKKTSLWPLQQIKDLPKVCKLNSGRFHYIHVEAHSIDWEGCNA